jgi:hypothetical protein
MIWPSTVSRSTMAAQRRVGEGLGPAAEQLVGGDGDGGLLPAFGQDQQFGAAPVKLHASELVRQLIHLSAAIGRAET